MKKHSAPPKRPSATKTAADFRKPTTPDALEAMKLWNGEKVNLSWGSKRILQTRKVIKKGNGSPKGLVASFFLTSKKAFVNTSLLHLVYYPLPEHFWLFEEANNYVRKGGPGREFPGSVGSASIFLSPIYAEGDKVVYIGSRQPLNSKTTLYLTIDYMQGHFSQRQTPELTRAIATKYGGWKNRLLDEIFKAAEENNWPVAIRNSHISRAGENFFETYAETRGYKTRRTATYILAEKPSKQSKKNL